jgi:hypothetical protein
MQQVSIYASRRCKGGWTEQEAMLCRLTGEPECSTEGDMWV